MSDEVKAVRVPGGEAALSKALRAFFAQDPPRCFRAFYAALHSLTLYYMEKGDRERRDYSELLEELFKIIDKYSRAFNSYWYYWRIGAPAQVIASNELTEIINTIFRSGVIPPTVLSEIIEVAAEDMIKVREIDKSILAGSGEG